MFNNSRKPVPSKSTDKLIALEQIAQVLPDVAFEGIKTFELNWQFIDKMAVPIIKITYKD